MTHQIIVDTGPLVAFLFRRDQHHEWAKTQWADIQSPMLTCEAVITEACFLLRRSPIGVKAVLELLQRGVLQIEFRLEDEMNRVARLMASYEDVPMSLADACLVRMSELHPQSVVWTLDADFRRYRRKGRRVIPLLIPDARR